MPLEIYKHMLTGFMGQAGSFERQVIYTARARINSLKKQRDELDGEIEFWERIIAYLAPCDTCKGTGDEYEDRGGERLTRINCRACNGTATSRKKETKT